MWVFLFIMLVHWFSDFVLQTRHMATRKSEDNYYLGLHVSIYSLSTIFFWFLMLLFTSTDINLVDMLISFVLIFSTHWVTDYFTSRLSSKFYKKEDYYNFFNVIGIDQWLHYLTLFLIFEYVILTVV